MEGQAEQVRHDDFVRLLSCHARQIFGFILTLSPNRADAEDIFQNASVALWKKFDTYQQGTNFRAWAYQVAYFEVVEHRRQKSKLRSLLSEEAFEALAADAMVMRQENAQHEDALAACLEKLSFKDRKLIESRYFNSQTTKQIAERSSRSIYAIYRSLARIHDALLRCVKQAMAGEQRI
jgi:RNA polymerase sigma-70 factor (ECF subfamily)